MRLSLRHLSALTVALLTASCSGGADDRLGPLDDQALPPADLERIAVGDEAPDFRLASLAGETVRLSDFRGDKDVVLVFYRGHW